MPEDAKVDELAPDFELEERLFHFTSSMGLFGILESGCLWASHFQFLNDSKELFSAKASLEKYVEYELKKWLAAQKVNNSIGLNSSRTIEDISSQESKRIVELLYKATLGSRENKGVIEPYVFSTFCCSSSDDRFATGGLLHWATYGQNGGYSIQLNPHKLDQLVRE
jgi:hypothetical protein